MARGWSLLSGKSSRRSSGVALARNRFGFGEKSLRRMIQFAEEVPEHEIVATLWRQLSWSHFRVLLPIRDALKRDFYADMFHERTALSKKPETLSAAKSSNS